MAVRPVQHAGTGNVSELKKKPQVSLTKDGIAAFLMFAGAIGAGIGSGVAWGAGVGVFAGCVMLYATGVLLGISD